MRVSCFIAASTIAVAGVCPASAQDIAAGKALYKKECKTCHGPTAKGMASYPKLAGRSTDYLTDKLKRYRAGEKFGPNTPLMAPRAKILSDKDIDNVVAFIVETFK